MTGQTTYHATLTRLVDADTAHFAVTLVAGAQQLGLGVRLTQCVEAEVTVRLMGVNAPEVRTAEGIAAKAWALLWFADHPGPYTLTTAHDRRDDYGRLLATVTAADGAELGPDLLAAGHAVIYPPAKPKTADPSGVIPPSESLAGEVWYPPGQDGR